MIENEVRRGSLEVRPDSMWLPILTMLSAIPSLPVQPGPHSTSLPTPLGCSTQSLPLTTREMLSLARQSSLCITFICSHDHPPLDSEFLLLLVLILPATGTVLAQGRHSIMLDEPKQAK